MTSDTKVDGEEWAQRVRRLSPEEREERLQHVNALLAAPEDISDPLETELYILHEQLTGQAS
jgi:hypothetical protein